MPLLPPCRASQGTARWQPKWVLFFVEEHKSSPRHQTLSLILRMRGLVWKPKVLLMTCAANSSVLLQCIHQAATVFIYRPARRQVQGEFSQFEAVWPLAVICSCCYSPLLSAHFCKALVWPVAGGDSAEVSGRVMGSWALTRNNETRVGNAITMLHGKKLVRRD